MAMAERRWQALEGSLGWGDGRVSSFVAIRTENRFSVGSDGHSWVWDRGCSLARAPVTGLSNQFHLLVYTKPTLCAKAIGV
jgi:hypothetical protein